MTVRQILQALIPVEPLTTSQEQVPVFPGSQEILRTAQTKAAK